VTTWRICKPKYEKTAFDGAGAASYPGRWNKHGQYVVYTSDSMSLAVLEILVNVTTQMLPLYRLFSCSFEDTLITEIDTLPAGWRQLVNPGWFPLQELGSSWYESCRSAVLRVPSAVIPDQNNYILNVRHPDFSRIAFYPPRDLATDPRLMKA